MAYSNTRYRHSPKLITPIQRYPEIQQIEKIQPVEKIEPFYRYQGLDEKRRTYERLRQDKQTQTFLANYNDPTELNSYIDALTNREAVSKKFGDAWGTFSTLSGTVSVLSFAGSIIATALSPVTGGASMAAVPVFKTIAAVSAIPAIPAAVDVTVEKGIKPILAGKPKEAGLNMLMNLGETMDYAANPIKGLFIEGGEGFLKGTGLAEGGRVNYDYDTGSFITDMLLELVSDPMNWVDLGAGIGLKIAVKNVAEPMAKELVAQGVEAANKSIIKELSSEITEAQVESITKKVTKSISQAIRELNAQPFKTLTEAQQKAALDKAHATIRNSLVSALKEANPKLTSKELNLILNNTQELVTNKQLSKTLYEQINDYTMDALSSEVIRSTSGVLELSDTWQKAMTKGALMTSGYGGSLVLLKKSFNPALKHLQSLRLQKLSKAKVWNKDTGFDLTQYVKAKKYWELSSKYTNSVARTVDEQANQTFYRALEAQLNNMQSAVNKTIRQYSKEPIVLAAKLDELIGQMQPNTKGGFKEYISLLKGINDTESGMLNDYIKQLETQYHIVSVNAAKAQMGQKIYNAGSVVTNYSLKNFSEENVFKEVRDTIAQGLTKAKNKKHKVTDTQYALKISNDVVNGMLLNTDSVQTITDVILDTSSGFGALLRNIDIDALSLGADASAELRNAITKTIQAAQSIKNLEQLYNAIGTITDLPEDLVADEFYRFLLNEIMGLQGTVGDLYVNFEATITQLYGNLEKLYASAGKVGYNLFDQSPALDNQIRTALKNFLEEQYDNQVININTGVLEDFTENLSTIVGYTADTLDTDTVLLIGQASEDLRNLRLIKEFNDANLSITGTQKAILELGYGDADLTMLGLARRTIIEDTQLKLFDFTENDSIMFVQAKEIAHRISDIAERAKQHTYAFTPEIEEQIKKAYAHLFKYNIPTFSNNALFDCYKHLAETDDIYVMYSTLCEVYKSFTPATRAERNGFSVMLEACITDANLKFNIKHPNQFLRTEYYHNPVAYSKAFVDKQFKEEELNLIQKWQNFNAGASKVQNDMQAVKELYASSDKDKVKAMLLDRYIGALDRTNKALNYLQDVNTRLYNADVVTKNTELIYNAFNEYPEIQKRYQDIMDTAEGYWAQELTLHTATDNELTQQYIRRRRELIGEYYNTNQAYPDAIARNNIDNQLKQEFSEEAIDEYTALADDFSNMLLEIENKTRAQVEELYKEKLSTRLSKASTDYKENTLKKVLRRDERSNAKTRTVHKSNLHGELRVHEDGTASWSVRHATEVPYKETPEYDPELDYISDETYSTKLDKWLTKVDRSYSDADYARSLYDYHGQYTAAWRLRRSLLIPEADTDMLNKDLSRIATTPGSIKEGTPDVFNAQTFDTLQEVHNHILTNYYDELLEAREYVANQKFVPEMYDSRKAFIKSLDEEQNKIYARYAAYTTNTLNKYPQHSFGTADYYEDYFSVFDKLITDGITQARAQHKNAQALLQVKQLCNKQFAAERNIMYAPVNDIINKTQTDFRALHGQRVNELLHQKFQPHAQKMIDDFYAEQAKYNPLLEASKISLKDPFVDQIEYNRVIRKATDAHALNTLALRLQKTPEQMFNDLVYGFGQFVFAQDDLTSLGYNKYQFNRLVQQYKAAGIDYISDKDAKWHMFYIKDWNKIKMVGRQAYYDTNPIMRVQVTKDYTEYNTIDAFIKNKLGEDTQAVNELYKNLDNDMFEFTGANTGYSQGEAFNTDSFAQYYNALPEEFRDALGKDYLEYMTDPSFFQTIRYNECFTGTLARKRDMKLFATDAVFSARNAYSNAAYHIKGKTEYVNTVFDSSYSINSTVFEGFSDEDLLAALQLENNYKLIALVEDKKYGVRVQEIIPLSIEDIAKAKELNAVVVPLQIYKDMYNTVNHRLGSSGFAQFWARIVYAYKFGYLCRPGAWIRNWFDTNIKSKIEMGDEYKLYMERAHTVLNEFDKVQEYVLAHGLTDETGATVPLRTVIQQYFDNAPDAKINFEQYLELQDNYFSQGVADNVMQQFIRELNGTATGDLWSEFTQLTGKILEKPNITERYNRLAVYLYELDHGADYTSALAKLSNIHFDYSFKTKAEQLIDMVFPFTTFSLRNYSYWFEMLEKKPWLLRNYAHIMKPHYDFKDYTPEELARDYRAQSQILNGQLKLDILQNNLITFKANPSIQNALSMFSDPINMVYENLAAPISVPLKLARNEYTSPLNLIPIAGPAIQSVKTMVKTGSPMPSAIGVQKKSSYTGNVKFRNKNLSGTNKFTDKTYRTPKYRNNYVFDSYATKGIARYRLNMYPIVDVYHDIKMRVSTNVYNRIKNRVKTDVYKGIRYQIRLDANRLR